MEKTTLQVVRETPRMRLEHEMRQAMAEALAGKRHTVSHTSRRHPLARPVEYKLAATHMVQRLLDEMAVSEELMQALQQSECHLVARLRMAIIDTYVRVMADNIEEARAAVKGVRA